MTLRCRPADTTDITERLDSEHRWSAIYSKHHALLSLAITAAFLVLSPDPTAAGLPVPALVGYGVGIGVLVDLDHFVIERVLHGKWGAVGRAVERPSRVVVGQSELFPDETMSPLDRLLSHAVIVGVAVPATWFVAPALGTLTAIVLYGHVLSDLAWDVYRRRVADGPPHIGDLR